MPKITTTHATFELAENENLLTALEKTGHHVEYQCRSGYCGSCRLKLCSGTVSYPQTPMAFIMPNEILPCCCQVQSDLVIVCELNQPNDSHTKAVRHFDSGLKSIE